MQLFDDFLNLWRMREAMDSKSPKWGTVAAGAALVVVLAAWALGQAAWWRLFAFPYGAFIALGGSAFGSEIAAGNLGALLELIGWGTYYPPLYELALGTVNALAGFGLGNAVVLNFVLMAGACVAVFAVVRKLADPFAALVACLLLLGADIAFEMSRIPAREIAVLASVAWLLALLQNRRLLWSPWLAAACGGVLAAGMLFKWTFPIYAALPTVAVFAWGIFAEKGQRAWRIGMVAVALGVALVLCAPWYLGVLDLKYLAVSSANDPHPDPLLWLLPYYPRALGMTALGGVNAAWAMLAAAAVVVGLRRRAVLAPALATFGALTLLMLIPHKEERYVLGMLPGLAILAGTLAGYVPRRWWLRGPLLAALIAALTWNFVHLSFDKLRFSYDSGAVYELPSADCLPDGLNLAQRIVRAATEAYDGEHPVRIATHPLNRHAVTFNQDMFPLLISLAGQRNNIHFTGYALPRFVAFAQEISTLDVLIVADNVWGETEGFVDGQMAAWKDFRNPDWEVKGDIPGDPRRRDVIEQYFDLYLEQPSSCFPRIFVYVRKGLIGDKIQPYDPG